MITGTPPIARGGFQDGFVGSPHSGLMAKQELSESEVDLFVQRIFGASAEPFLRQAVKRADRRFRARVFEASRAGEGVDQRLTVEESSISLGVMNDGADHIINLDYLDTLSYGNLWDGRTHRLAGAGHVAFWDAPRLFNPVLERFLNDAELLRQ
jgi:hypothetical protein